MNFQEHRPPGAAGAGDRQLAGIVRRTARFLLKVQVEFAHDTLRLTAEEAAEVAGVLVEFAEDIHNEIGLWQTLEQYQREFFGTPLPLFLRPDEQLSPDQLYEYRLRSLLWGLYPELRPDMILAPTHQDLHRLAAKVADFLRNQFTRVPRDSGVKLFLAQPNQFGWQVKRKLIWLGRHAYLFRHRYQTYLAEQGAQETIITIDDFICRQTTGWAGLGAIDILARTLEISASQRAELRSWYERHLACYRVLVVKKSQLTLKNLINDQVYRVKMENAAASFKAGKYVMGSLVPWAGWWYWSGEQATYDDLPADALAEIQQTFGQKMATIVYRYDKARAQAAKETLDRLYQAFLQAYGDNLVAFPDGLSMAAAMQQFYRLFNEALPAEVASEVMARRGLTSAAPKMPYPPELIACDDGVGVYFNPEEGTELMTGFNDVVSGLKKGGQGLSEAEEDAIYGLLTAEAISPSFVRRLVEDYGDASIAAVFLIRDGAGQPYLDYLLRRHKGHFFRKRYPNVGIV